MAYPADLANFTIKSAYASGTYKSNKYVGVIGVIQRTVSDVTFASKCIGYATNWGGAIGGIISGA